MTLYSDAAKLFEIRKRTAHMTGTPSKRYQRYKSGKLYQRKTTRPYNKGYKDLSEEEKRRYHKNAYIKNRYGIDLITFEEHKKNGCAICGRRDKLVIDHCHVSTAFRGVLCNGCNRGLGFFSDDPERLSRAAEYAMKFNMLLR